MFLHGGPGAGNLKGYHKMFDPDRYLIIYMDQRGCSQSRPLVNDYTDLGGNNTAALISDIESLRNHLGIEKWMNTGGSCFKADDDLTDNVIKNNFKTSA